MKELAVIEESLDLDTDRKHFKGGCRWRDSQKIKLKNM